MSIKNKIIETNESIINAANRLGISRQHLNDICLGSAFPSRKLAIKIEEITNGGVPIVVFGFAKQRGIDADLDNGTE